MIDFTPGIWTYNPKDGSVFTKNDTDNEINVIAYITWFDTPFSLEFFQSIANSRLITAAPHMYYLLIELLENGLDLDKCICIRELLNYIECSDIDTDDEEKLLKIFS